jgi:hypothetical protein
MDGDKTIGPLVLQQLGQGLQGGFGIQTRLPLTPARCFTSISCASEA